MKLVIFGISKKRWMRPNRPNKKIWVYFLANRSRREMTRESNFLFSCQNLHLPSHQWGETFLPSPSPLLSSLSAHTFFFFFKLLLNCWCFLKLLILTMLLTNYNVLSIIKISLIKKIILIKIKQKKIHKTQGSRNLKPKIIFFLCFFN